MAGQKVSVKQAFIMIYNELAGVTLPAEQFLNAGVRIGNALRITQDCIESLEQEERAAFEAAQAAQAEQQRKTPAETATEQPAPDGSGVDAMSPDGQNMTHDFGPVQADGGGVE